MFNPFCVQIFTIIQKNEQELKIFENNNINSKDLIPADSIDDAFRGNFNLTFNNNTKRIRFKDESIFECVDSEYGDNQQLIMGKVLIIF